jgi:CO dehydrogenase/acetyl-CoA synthase delta subunit
MKKEIYNKIISKEFQKELQVAKDYFDKADELMEGIAGGYGEKTEYENKLIRAAEYAENKARENCLIFSEILDLGYQDVLSLVFDYEATVKNIRKTLDY